MREYPTSFLWVGNNEGKPVGPAIVFDHYERNDDMHREADARMRERVQHGLQANAVRYLDSEPMGGGISITKIQPCLV